MYSSNGNMPEMPQPLDCERCGQLSTVHANQYIYKPRQVGHYDEEQVLVAIITLISCPNCGVHTQTVEIDHAEREDRHFEMDGS